MGVMTEKQRMGCFCFGIGNGMFTVVCRSEWGTSHWP